MHLSSSAPGNAFGLIGVGIFALVWCSAQGARAGEPWRPAKGPLMTRWAGEVTGDRALGEYPRPQMLRKEWLNLNGLWDYAVTGKAAEQAPGSYEGQILVPFPIESALSGVMKPLKPDERLWYRRTFTVPKEWSGQRVLLHFGAVDWEAAVALNGKRLGGHRGGYDAFTFDITAALKKDGPQELVVSVLDPTDASWQLHGKQALKPAGQAYLPDVRGGPIEMRRARMPDHLLFSRRVFGHNMPFRKRRVRAWRPGTFGAESRKVI